MERGGFIREEGELIFRKIKETRMARRAKEMMSMIIFLWVLTFCLVFDF